MESYGGMALLLVVVTSAIAFLQVGFPVPEQGNALRVSCSSHYEDLVRSVAGELPQIAVELARHPPQEPLQSILLGQESIVMILDGSNRVGEAEALGEKIVRVELPALRPALVVDAGNPKNVSGLEDLLRDDLRVSLGRPGDSVLGNATRAGFDRLGLWSAMEERIAGHGAFKTAEKELLRDVLFGLVDATIVWTSAAESLGDRVEVLHPPGLENLQQPVLLIRRRAGAREGETSLLMERLQDALSGMEDR